MVSAEVRTNFTKIALLQLLIGLGYLIPTSSGESSGIVIYCIEYFTIVFQSWLG